MRPRFTVLASSLVVDGVAAWFLLSGGPGAGVGAAALLHVLAALMVHLSAPPGSCRGRLARASALALPLAGSALAVVVLMVRGRGLAIEDDAHPGERGAGPDRGGPFRAAEAIAQYDVLECGDDDRRHAALRSLAARSDPEARVVLRHATASADPDVALSAALVLDQILERIESLPARRTAPAQTPRVAAAR